MDQEPQAAADPVTGGGCAAAGPRRGAGRAAPRVLASSDSAVDGRGGRAGGGGGRDAVRAPQPRATACWSGVPGLGKTLLVHAFARLLGLPFARIQFTPDLMPSDITGTEILEEDAATGQRQVRVRARARLHQRAPGRRDQPHAAQDPGRAAGGHAGEDGDHRRQGAPPGGAVHRAGHAEPHRAGGHLPAARGPARPLPLRAADRLPVPGGGAAAWSTQHSFAPTEGLGPLLQPGRRSSPCGRRWPACPRAPNVVDYAVRLVRATPAGATPPHPTTSSGGCAGEPARGPART